MGCGEFSWAGTYTITCDDTSDKLVPRSRPTIQQNPSQITIPLIAIYSIFLAPILALWVYVDCSGCSLPSISALLLLTENAFHPDSVPLRTYALLILTCRTLYAHPAAS